MASYDRYDNFIRHLKFIISSQLRTNQTREIKFWWWAYLCCIFVSLVGISSEPRKRKLPAVEDTTGSNAIAYLDEEIISAIHLLLPRISDSIQSDLSGAPKVGLGKKNVGFLDLFFRFWDIFQFLGSWGF